MEDRILAYIGERGVATPEHLVNNLGMSEDEVASALDELERRGWIARGWARFVESPDPGVTTLMLTPAGEKEFKRRQTLSPTSKGPVELSREELATELKSRFGWSDEQVSLEPTLRASRFLYWPSIGAYAAKT